MYFRALLLGEKGEIHASYIYFGRFTPDFQEIATALPSVSVHRSFLADKPLISASRLVCPHFQPFICDVLGTFVNFLPEILQSNLIQLHGNFWYICRVDICYLTPKRMLEFGCIEALKFRRFGLFGKYHDNFSSTEVVKRAFECQTIEEDIEF